MKINKYWIFNTLKKIDWSNKNKINKLDRNPAITLKIKCIDKLFKR